MCQNSCKDFNQNQGKPEGIIHCCASVWFCFDLWRNCTVQTIALILVIASVWQDCSKRFNLPWPLVSETVCSLSFQQLFVLAWDSRRAFLSWHSAHLGLSTLPCTLLLDLQRDEDTTTCAMIGADVLRLCLRILSRTTGTNLEFALSSLNPLVCFH